MMAALASYPERALDALVATLGRAASGREIDRIALERQLLDLFHATGAATDGSEEHRLFQELAAERLTDRDLAAAFASLAEAENPLDPSIAPSQVRAELSAAIRSRWSARWRQAGRPGEPVIGSIDWSILSDAEREEIRTMLHGLAGFRRSSIRRGRPRKSVLDTVLLGLADIYAEFSGFSRSSDEIAYSINGRFVAFAAAALEPLGGPDRPFALSELSMDALSRRWERLVLPGRKAARSMDATP